MTWTGVVKVNTWLRYRLNLIYKKQKTNKPISTLIQWNYPKFPIRASLHCNQFNWIWCLSLPSNMAPIMVCVYIICSQLHEKSEVLKMNALLGFSIKVLKILDIRKRYFFSSPLLFTNKHTVLTSVHVSSKV